MEKLRSQVQKNFGEVCSMEFRLSNKLEEVGVTTATKGKSDFSRVRKVVVKEQL